MKPDAVCEEVGDRQDGLNGILRRGSNWAREGTNRCSATSRSFPRYPPRLRR